MYFTPKNAERIKQKHSKYSKTHKYEVGEYAGLRIPRIDRSSTDLQRLPCIIVEVIGKAQSMYRLRCKFGILQTCFHAGDLEPFKATYDIPVEGWQGNHSLHYEKQHAGKHHGIHSRRTTAIVSQAHVRHADVTARKLELTAAHTVTKERDAKTKHARRKTKVSTVLYVSHSLY